MGIVGQCWRGPHLAHFQCNISETSLRAMAKAMKAMRAAKAMKAMKRVSKFAKGRFAKSVVFRGTKTATTGGLTKANLMKNKNGKIVSKKANANGPTPGSGAGPSPCRRRARFSA